MYTDALNAYDFIQLDINFAKVIQNIDMLFFSFIKKVDEAMYEGFSHKEAQILSKSNIEC